mmetsp:Transcript_15840/g.46831  ORF Transcript_15840/g.46831 Transcript_15840/m.46831 type:complete len:217 (-) Transcript_15840:915-1565(-)
MCQQGHMRRLRRPQLQPRALRTRCTLLAAATAASQAARRPEQATRRLWPRTQLCRARRVWHQTWGRLRTRLSSPAARQTWPRTETLMPSVAATAARRHPIHRRRARRHRLRIRLRIRIQVLARTVRRPPGPARRPSPLLALVLDPVRTLIPALPLDQAPHPTQCRRRPGLPLRRAPRRLGCGPTRASDALSPSFPAAVPIAASASTAAVAAAGPAR